jgi:2-phospho-L-lactate guanylyltransferase (CobY/MobA/RfbA family)
VARVIVITDDPGFGDVALATGCEVISDPTDSLNGAISHAGTSVGPGPIAVVVSDIPGATPEAFADLFSECENGLFGQGLAADLSMVGA